MKINYYKFAALTIVSVLFIIPVSNCQEYFYTLVHGSSITDDCKICGRPTIPFPIKGNFTVKITNQTPISTEFSIKAIRFYSGSQDDPTILITGDGTGRIFGEVALVQSIRLNLTIYVKGGTNRFLTFTNTSGVVTIAPPMVQCELAQTEEDPVQFYTLNINAAPFNEIWFSTESGFTSANSPPINGSPADVLSNTGKKIKSKADLIKNLNIQNPPSDLNIDALDVISNGKILFSFNQTVTGATPGVIYEGDVVSDSGEIVYRNTDLLSKMGFMPPTPQLGLDALQVLDTNEVLFSTRSDAFSEMLGALVQNGDILSSKGYIFKKNKDLLQRFQPSDQNTDYGLDAFYLWDNGEIWFSTKIGFNSQTAGSILAGDLLSDKGYVVFRNLELLEKFSPLEDLADFGLDGLFIVTDITSSPTPPIITDIKLINGAININWQGNGRVFRIEKADEITGPFVPVETTTAKEFNDTATPAASKPKQFYRVRQW